MVRPVLPLIDYLINEDYIAEFLCINKGKVEMQCKGKCYLMQQLSKQNEDKKQSLPRIAMEEYPIGFVNLVLFNVIDETIPFIENSFMYQNNYNYLLSYYSFHPPDSTI